MISMVSVSGTLYIDRGVVLWWVGCYSTLWNPKKSSPPAKGATKLMTPKTKKKKEGAQCEAVNRDGKRCKHRIKGRSKLCPFHQNAVRGATAKGDGVSNIYRIGQFTSILDKYGPGAQKAMGLSDELVLLKTMLGALLERLPVAPPLAEGGVDEGDGDSQLPGSCELCQYRLATSYIQIGPAVQGYTEVIGRTAERIERIANMTKSNINPRQVAVLANQIIAIINEEVADPGVRQRIAERIATIVLVEG